MFRVPPDTGVPALEDAPAEALPEDAEPDAVEDVEAAGPHPQKAVRIIARESSNVNDFFIIKFLFSF